MKSLFEQFDLKGAAAKDNDVYYSPKGVRAPTILHETLHKTLNGIADPALAGKLGISRRAYKRAGTTSIIDDRLARGGCK